MTNIIEQHREEVAVLCRRARARRLDVFGSAVRADFDPATSDLDFLVEFDELPPTQYVDAYFALKESLESLFGRPVDLVTDGSLENPYFRDRIYAERKLVYATLTPPSCSRMRGRLPSAWCASRTARVLAS